MKKIILLFCALVSLALLVFIFTSDSKEVQLSTINVEGKFSISIPEYLTKTDSIDSSALLQYQNDKKQLFLLVYEISDTSALKDFFKKTSDDFISKLEHGTLMKYYPEKVNGADAMIGTIRGSVNETGVYYKIAVIQSGNSFYKIITGISENRKSDYDEDMDKIIRGFKKIS